MKKIFRENFGIIIAMVVILAAFLSDIFFHKGPNDKVFFYCSLGLCIALLMQNLFWLKSKMYRAMIVNLPLAVSIFLGLQFSTVPNGGGFQLYAITLAAGMYIFLFLQLFVWLIFGIKTLHKKLSKSSLKNAD
jgi:hypothetical protein